MIGDFYMDKLNNNKGNDSSKGIIDCNEEKKRVL